MNYRKYLTAGADDRGYDVNGYTVDGVFDSSNPKFRVGAEFYETFGQGGTFDSSDDSFQVGGEKFQALALTDGELDGSLQLWQISDLFDATFEKVYDKDGFNPVTGLNRDGVNRHGQDADGFRFGYSQRADRAGRFAGGTSSYDADGYNESGRDRDGFNPDGITNRGFNRLGINVLTGRTVDTQGWFASGYDREGTHINTADDPGGWNNS